MRQNNHKAIIMSRASGGRVTYFQMAALFCYAVLFPGFVVYHYGVAAEWIPPFAGGLFGAASIMTSLIGTVFLLFNYLSNGGSTSLIERAFPLFLIYLILWTLLAYIAIDGQIYATSAMKESIATIVIWIAVFFIGAQLRLPSRGIGLVHTLLIIAVLACFIHAIASQGSFLGPYLTFSGEHGDNEVVATYQGIGRSIVVIAILATALSKRLFSQLTILGVATAILVTLGSRSHLFVTALLLITHLTLFGLRKRNLPTGIVSILILLVAAYYAYSVVLETRAAEVFDLAQSASWQARMAAHYEALDVIEANPLIGNFGYHLGVSHGYAHNILSVWTEYGLIGFLSFAGLMLYALALSAHHVIFRRAFSPLWLIAFQLNFVALFLALFTEPIMASVFPALGWGFTVQAIRADQRNKALLLHQLSVVQASHADKSGTETPCVE